MSSLLVTAEDKKLMQSYSKESQGCIGIDLCAPDTLDLMQGTCIFVFDGKNNSLLIFFNICILLLIY